MADISLLNGEELRLIMAFADSDMLLSRTAQKVFFSPATVAFKFNRIEKKTGLNPRRFWDLFDLLSEIRKEMGSA